MSSIQESGFSLGGVVEHFENVLPKSQAEAVGDEAAPDPRRLSRRVRGEDFYGFKVVVPPALCSIGWVTGLVSLNPFFVLAIALGLGFLIPDFWLGHLIKKRQAKIRRGLPDVLDLLIICIEAGLSLDQATSRTAEELKLAQPELCDELMVVVLEQRAGRPRAEAWKHMSDRTGVESVRNLTSMLVQSEQFGTSIAKTLRIHSDTLESPAHSAGGGGGCQDHHQADFPAGVFHFSCALCGGSGSGGHHDGRCIYKYIQSLREGEFELDTTTAIQGVAEGICRSVTLFVERWRAQAR